ncbi:methyltransferase domain-containing protein [Deltaproteobacteria bacterium TL4]
MTTFTLSSKTLQPDPLSLSPEQAVLQRYAQASQQKETALCCPVSYNPRYLQAIPQEILEKDYGCGDPSQFLKEGETVLDLGSGAGKICYIASQIVGKSGRVIGVDFNPPMLALARKYQQEVAERLGWNNVTFLRAKIQDLATDLDTLEQQLSQHPIYSLEDYYRFEEQRQITARQAPLIEDESIDVIVSNCVLNLVQQKEKRQLFQEMMRVLKLGGRVAISDIVSDEAIPQELQNNPELWSGCISGAFQEQKFLKAFEEAGFYGIHIQKRDAEPWRVIEGIEFRSVTLVAYKGKQGACWERNQAVIYKGPWSTAFS